MNPRIRRARRAGRRLGRVLLLAVAGAGGLAALLTLGPITLWGLLYCTIKPPLDCLLSLLVLLLVWGVACALVGLALLGARRLRG